MLKEIMMPFSQLKDAIIALESDFDTVTVIEDSTDCLVGDSSTALLGAKLPVPYKVLTYDLDTSTLVKYFRIDGLKWSYLIEKNRNTGNKGWTFRTFIPYCSHILPSSSIAPIIFVHFECTTPVVLLSSSFLLITTHRCIWLCASPRHQCQIML